MIEPITKNYKGLVIVTGPTRSGKSQLAEFLLKEQESVTYIATSKPRPKDNDWQKRITIHRKRRPLYWKLIECPIDISETIECNGAKDAILLDSLGGFVEHHIIKNEIQWETIQDKLIKSLTNRAFFIIVVAEEVGWGIVPSTPIGHLFRERLTTLNSLISRVSNKRCLVMNGTAIDLDNVGEPLP